MSVIDVDVREADLYNTGDSEHFHQDNNTQSGTTPLFAVKIEILAAAVCSAKTLACMRRHES